MTDIDTGPLTSASRVATFLSQALALPPDTDVAAVAADLAIISTTPGRTVYATRMESAIGPAAFLVYAYDVLATDPGGAKPGVFARDVDTITRATGADTPGPRILAHATDGDHAYILATSPSTFRALAGVSAGAGRDDEMASLPPGTDRDAARRDAATHLLRLLRQADLHASVWFAAIEAPEGETTEHRDHLDFNDAEAELALFLLDDRSIKRLLRLLQVYIAAAKQARA
ncbi:MAG: hypothetical protein WKF80_03600 [Thermomicrobiales bacterium]